MVIETLTTALSLKRPSNGEGEAKLAAWIARHIHITMIDGAGNLHVDVRSQPHHRTLFTAHLDTVHNAEGPNTYTIEGHLWKAQGAPLGADCGAGVALMMHMIASGVAGYFLFTRAEESGGVGALHLAEHHPNLLVQFDRAIAFDRAGYHDVITHQGGQRCASEEFALALADQLSNDSLLWCPDSTGVYTDTAEFTDLIPECTNLSVGYFHQHSDREYQDVAFLHQVAEQLVKVDWDGLPVKRDVMQKDWTWPYKSDPFEDAYYSALDEALGGNYAELRAILLDELTFSDDIAYLDERRIPYKTLEKVYALSISEGIKTMLEIAFYTPMAEQVKGVH